MLLVQHALCSRRTSMIACTTHTVLALCVCSKCIRHAGASAVYMRSSRVPAATMCTHVRAVSSGVLPAMVSRKDLAGRPPVKPCLNACAISGVKGAWLGQANPLRMYGCFFPFGMTAMRCELLVQQVSRCNVAWMLTSANGSVVVRLASCCGTFFSLNNAQ